MSIKRIKSIGLSVLLGCSLLFGCESDKATTLTLIDGEVYKNPKVQDFDGKISLEFEPYTGIYFQSSIDNKKIDVILFTDDTEDLTNSTNLYNDDGKTFDDVYQDVKDENITALGLRTFTPKDKNFWSPILDRYEQNLGLSITKEQTEQGTRWKYENEIVLEVEFHPQNGNLIKLRIYPIENKK